MNQNTFDLLQIRDDTFVSEISYHEQLASTNTTAIELSKTEMQTPLLVLAETQSAGRGRGGNAWWSSPGALTFSLLIDLPMLRPDQIGPLSLSVGLAICQTIEMLAPAGDVALKWPNDVYLEGKKICGILIESPVATEPQLAIGIGINVNNAMSDAPDALRNAATSLSDELGEPLDQNRILIACLQQLEARINDHVHQRDRLLDQWRAYCMLTGRTVSVETHGRRIVGKCEGVDEEGVLLIRDEDHELHRCIAGTVSFSTRDG